MLVDSCRLAIPSAISSDRIQLSVLGASPRSASVAHNSDGLLRACPAILNLGLGASYTSPNAVGHSAPTWQSFVSQLSTGSPREANDIKTDVLTSLRC